MIGCSFCNALIGLCDMWIAGGIGPQAQAAVGIGEQFIFVTVSAVTGLTVAASALASQAIGARKLALARAYARDGLSLSIVFGLLALTACLVCCEQLFKVLTVPVSVARLGSRYLYICAFGNLPFAALLMIAALLRSFGRPGKAFLMTLVCGVLSVGGAWLFTGPFCFLGIDALGLSWLVGATVGSALGYIFLLRALKRSRVVEDLPALHTRWRSLMFLALPAALSELVYGAATLLFFQQILQSSGGAAAEAAYAACAKIEETFAAMPMQAVSQATACVVGRLVGAADFSAATRVARNAAICSAPAMVFAGTIIAWLAPAFSHVFSASAETQQAIAFLLSYSPALFGLLGITMSSTGALEGAGRCARAAIVYCAAAALLRLPIAALMCCLGAGAIPLTVTALLSSRGLAALLMANDLRVGVCRSMHGYTSPSTP